MPYIRVVTRYIFSRLIPHFGLKFWSDKRRIIVTWLNWINYKMGQNEVSLEFFFKLSPSIHEMENDWMGIWLPSVLQVMISHRHNSSILLVNQLSSVAHLVITHYLLILILYWSGFLSGWVTLWHNCEMLPAHSWDRISLNLKKRCLEKALVRVTHDRAMNPAFRQVLYKKE